MENKRWTEEDVLKIQKIMQLTDVQSLNYVLNVNEEGGGDCELGDFILDQSPGPEELLEIQDTKNTLMKYVNKLPPRENKIIRLRFGLDDGVIRTLEEVGEYFGVTRERIRQIECKALKKLRYDLIVKGKYEHINDV